MKQANPLVLALAMAVIMAVVLSGCSQKNAEKPSAAPSATESGQQGSVPQQQAQGTAGTAQQTSPPVSEAPEPPSDEKLYNDSLDESFDEIEQVY